MRLIDADKLNFHDVSPAYGMMVIGVAEEDVDLAPTVDAVPVIRCKDCKHCVEYCRVVDGVMTKLACDLKYDDISAWRVSENDYCAWAERKAAEDER